MVDMPLADLVVTYVPGSHRQPWTWDDEERDILQRQGCCASGECAWPERHIEHEVSGSYQLALEVHIRETGVVPFSEGNEILLGHDGRVWDGHHRIVAARRLGIESLPVEFAQEVEVVDA